jgi:YidC/Oxa1 family membrane protein insertase
MTNEKRYVLCWLLIFAWLMGLPYVMKLAGIDIGGKKPAVIPPAQIAADKAKDKLAKPELSKVREPMAKEPVAKKAGGRANDVAKNGTKPAIAKAVNEPEIAVVEEAELVLGSVTDKSPAGYRLEARLTQKGAGIESVYSSRYNAEFEIGQIGKQPLPLIRKDRFWPPSLALTFTQGDATAKPAVDAEPNEEDVSIKKAADEAEDLLDSVLWEVVRDENHKIVRSVAGVDPVTNANVVGQAIVFRTKAANGVIVTKTFRLFPNTDGLEVLLKFESPDQDRSVVYNLLGPHGIPIEGEWYTYTFRDVVFGQLEGNEIKPISYSASEVVSATKPIDNTKNPLAFAGIENQYFAILVGPAKLPTGNADRWDSETIALLLKKDEKAPQKSDVGVRMTSRPITVGPNVAVEHTYRVFAGPKTPEALKPYHAESLATYRKNQWIPFAPTLARYVITPTLAFTYDLTARIARLFGGTVGNYGIAIILLTILVRGLMFPLGRKQALSAQKMQMLQPKLKEIQEKYKDDKEKLTREQFALYKREGVNPVGGCLPALIQLPIFVGLWQALNTSFPLRHATFLWIRDLSAPDMLFHVPFEIPVVSYYLGDWFNVLPFVVIALMLVQTKLFAPPATTPEAVSQQKMMKYMMIVMGVMFYKVPSGLGLYFITSSTWAICERLLLPKVTHAHLAGGLGSDPEVGDEKGPGARGGDKGGPGGNGAPAKPPGRIAQFWDRVLDEARKDSTYRKITEGHEEKEEKKEKGRDPERPRPKPRRR